MIKRLGAPKVDISAYVCIAIILGISLSLIYPKETMFPFIFF